MPAYRFCRPDDIPLLVRAINESATDGSEVWTVPRYKQAMREENLWPSSCMLAFGPNGETPVGVVFGCKRPHGTRIRNIQVHPEHRGQGHASHLLRSLSGKLAVLGPPRLVVEIADSEPDAIRFFEKLGYQKEAEYRDYRIDSASLPTPQENECIGPLRVEEAIEAKLLGETPMFAWERQNESLLGLGKKVKGIGFASVDAIEACLFFEETEPACLELLRFSALDTSVQDMFFVAMIRALRRDTTTELRLRKLSDSEITFKSLEDLGFKEDARYTVLSRMAEAH